MDTAPQTTAEQTRALTLARYFRTRAFTAVRSTIRHNIDSPAPHTDSRGLPSWWPFWNDEVLPRLTRQLVQAARRVARLEGKEL